MTRTVVVAAVVAVVVALGAALPTAALVSADDAKHKRFTLVVRDGDASVTPKTLFTDPPVQNVQGSEDAPLNRGPKEVGRADTVYSVTRASSDDPEIMVECDVELPEGHLLFDGVVHLMAVAKGATVPVVGGSGA